DKEEYFNELKKKRAVGELLHHNTDEIIKFFGVPSVVENPQTSYCWKMFHKEFKKSVAHYIAYDRKFTKKPTTFASNVELKLLKAAKDMKQEHRWGYRKGQKNGNGYNKRSSIPEKLIIDIFKQLEDSVK
ncbi:hypothetical protein, partial [Brucella sp. CMUL 015]|uniref:hypothetical protein n=1 Tax=Brucella sp. CMUL 015 TaxID=1905697 RepID=UPI0018E9C207